MRKLNVFQTRIGPFYIALINGRYHPVYDDESLGSYINPQQAVVDDLANGRHAFSIAGGVDMARLRISCDLEEWELVLQAYSLRQGRDFTAQWWTHIAGSLILSKMYLLLKVQDLSTLFF